MGVEAEPGQEQEQVVQWTAEFEAMGSTKGETVCNITMSGATICDVAGITRARAGASLSDSHVPVKRTMHDMANTPIASGHQLPAPIPPLDPAMKALLAGHQISKGKPLELMDRPPTPSSSSSSTSEELDSDEREPKAK